MNNRLQKLRDQLGSIDNDILGLVKRRQQLALEIGTIKAAAGRSTRDYRQEREVIERSRRLAYENGVSPDFAEQLMLLLIRTSLTAQEKDRVAAQGEGNGKRVLVIGGAGNMGQWLARFLASQGFEIEIADPSALKEDGHNGMAHRTDWRDGTLDHDIIVIAAPLGISGEILSELATLKPSGVVFDVGSLKSPLRRGLIACRDAGIRITSVHPMFGPDTELLSGRHVIFVNLGNSEATKEATQTAKELFATTMATLVEMDLESHDRLIAYVLGLSHALNIAFFTALAESGETAPKLAQMSSTTFNSQLAVASSVASENPNLYFEIQSLNDYGTESLTALLYAIERLRSVIRAQDADGFAALMKRGDAYLKDRHRDESSSPT